MALHNNHRPTSRRFRSVPSCHGQTDGQTELVQQKAQFHRPPNSKTSHWNWLLVHTAKHCYRQSYKDQATIGLCCHIFLYFHFNANISNAEAVSDDIDGSGVVAGDSSYVSSSSLLLLLLSAVNHNASVSTHGVAHCRQELHATISSVVVSRYTRLSLLVVISILNFLFGWRIWRPFPYYSYSCAFIP